MTKDEILKELKKLCDKYPRMRFGQILFNYTKIGTRVCNNKGDIIGIRDCFYYEDDDFLESIGER